MYTALKTEIRKLFIWKFCNLQWEVFKNYKNYIFITPKPQRDMDALPLHSNQF